MEENKRDNCYSCIYDGGIVVGQDQFYCKLIDGFSCGKCKMFFLIDKARTLIEKERAKKYVQRIHKTVA